MKGLIAILLVMFAAVAQVNVSSLFPVSGAVGDLVLVTLALLAVFGSPRLAMVCIPIAALSLGFISDRAPGLLLLGYLPLLPVAFYIEEARLPLNHYARTLVAVLATGLWLRLLLVLGAIASGADAGLGAAVTMVLIPGLFLDFALLSVVYIPLRLVGWNGQGMSLQRGGYYSSL